MGLNLLIGVYGTAPYSCGSFKPQKRFWPQNYRELMTELMMMMMMMMKYAVMCCSQGKRYYITALKFAQSLKVSSTR